MQARLNRRAPHLYPAWCPTVAREHSSGGWIGQITFSRIREDISGTVKAFVLVICVMFCILAAGCTTPQGEGAASPVVTTKSPDSGFVLNESIRPGNDFFMHVNDAWIREHPIPADKSSYSTFSALSDKTDEDLNVLFLKAANATGKNADRNLTLLGQFYRSGMDTETINREGLSGLSDDLAMIDAIRTRPDLTNATVVLLVHGPGLWGSGPVYSWYAEINPRNASEVVPGLEQGGLGLPDRDYYLRTDNKSREIQDAYRAHIATVFRLAGEPEARAVADADTVYRMEKALASSHFTTEEKRDPETNTNLYTPEELEAKYPAIGWKTLFAIPGSGPVSRVNIHEPRYVEALNNELATAPLEDWKVYLRYHTINRAAEFLSQPFEDEDFAFYSTKLNGVTEMKPRWKRIVWKENDFLGNLAGRAYVSEYVDPRTRGMVTDMFSAIRQTMDERITALSWMNSSTKTAAREKLAAMKQKIAYPDSWRDYSGLVLTESYIGNVRAASAYDLIHGPAGLATIGKPVDPDAWFMDPQTVNAYYDPTRNEMVFPAAILQPPFFDPDADAASNYGSLGWVVGHEMTHGFDDQGRQFDKNGNLKDWWTAEDAENFNNRTALLVTEYNGFEVLPGLFENGNLTLGENIADLGGLTITYHAWKKADALTAGSGVSGISRDRQFFYAAARSWGGSYREDLTRNLVYTDPHSMLPDRVNGVVFNIPEFYEAFPEVKPGDSLYRNASQRPAIW
jgi:putative endopeptidase